MIATLWPGLRACLCMLAAWGSPGAPLHPADGPDVDLQWTVGTDQVRATVELNLVFVDELFPDRPPLAEPPGPAALEALGAQLERHLRGRMTVRAGGADLAGTAAPLTFVPADEALVPLFTRFGSRAVARVRGVWEFPLGAEARSLTFGWSDYPPDLAFESDRSAAPPIEVVAQLEAAGVLETVTLTRDRPLYRWQRPEGLANRFEDVPPAPVAAGLGAWDYAVCIGLGALAAIGIALRRRRIAVACAAVAVGWGAWAMLQPPPLPDVDGALAAFAPLHANLYRAFSEVEERRIYDALARSVDGALRDELYHQVYAGLVVEDGARARVERVRVHRADVVAIDRTDEGLPRARIEAEWQVDGALFHFGHSHRCAHEYRARYDLVAGAAGWRIRAHEPLARRQISSSTTDPTAPAAVPAVGGAVPR